jgi:hypothetical protein
MMDVKKQQQQRVKIKKWEKLLQGSQLFVAALPDL